MKRFTSSPGNRPYEKFVRALLPQRLAEASVLIGGKRYKTVTIDLFPTSYDLSGEAVRKIRDYIVSYINRNWAFKPIRRQFFIAGPVVVSFKVLRGDLNRVLRDICKIISGGLVRVG